jgi:outer membrane protein OmpA-like peptidoglycan-associated protein
MATALLMMKINFGCPDIENNDSLDRRLAFRAKSIFFETNKHDILAKSYPVLREISDIMRANPKSIFVVEGHADGSGGEALNLELSRNRAQAVTEFLISQGVPRASVQPAGFGIKYPLADNKSKTGRAKNRRVDITVKR